MSLKSIAQAAFAVSSVLGMQFAHAALVSCPTSFTSNPTAKVEGPGSTATAASACQYLTPPAQNNVASVANINTAGFFGSSNWTLNTGNLQLTGGASGSWSISNPNFGAYDYMIVFKDGNGTNLTGFLFNELYNSGVWSTPFTDPPFDLPGNSKVHDVSHYTIVQRPGTPTAMPEPGILALMGLGLAGLGAARRRSSRK